MMAMLRTSLFMSGYRERARILTWGRPNTGTMAVKRSSGMHGPCRAALKLTSRSNAETQRKAKEDAEKVEFVLHPRPIRSQAASIDMVFSAFSALLCASALAVAVALAVA